MENKNIFNPTPEEVAELERIRYDRYREGQGTPWDLDPNSAVNKLMNDPVGGK